MSTNDRFYLSYDIKIILKSYFWFKKHKDFVICLKLKTLFHNVSGKSIKVVIHFNAWHYF